jgi:hypothetical protein
MLTRFYQRQIDISTLNVVTLINTPRSTWIAIDERMKGAHNRGVLSAVDFPAGAASLV